MPDSTSRRRFLGRGLQTLGGAVVASRILGGPTKAVAADAVNVSEMIDKAVAFLKQRQETNGGWSTVRKEPGITALALTSMLRTKRVTPNEPTVTKGLAYLEQFLTPKGGLSEVSHANYATSITLLAFREANVKGRYDRLIKEGQDFLKSMQWDESEGKKREDDYYGGAGYGGGNSRPDLSNTSFFLESLRDTGLPADDPALKKALVFVSRCQNLKSEFNDQPWAGKINDGGFIYTAAKGGQSFVPGDGLRSYASMSYAGLKSMIYAGLTEDDPRVKAATKYISSHYSVDENPGLGQQGLYYYYHTFAKALSMLKQAEITDDKGVKHDWRTDLAKALSKRQSPDGSWVNPADRFMEGDANLVTAYALLALAHTSGK